MTTTALATRPERDVTTKSKNARTRADFAKAITEEWRNTLEGVIRTGLMLETAKAELKHGEWLAMIKNDLPFGARTAQKLKSIATNDVLRDAKFTSHLPGVWDTVYELTPLDRKTITTAIADGRIHPRMTRKDALALRPSKPRKPRKAKAPSPAPPPASPAKKPEVTAGPIGPVDLCAMQVRALIFKFADEMTPDQWPALIAELRDEIDDIEKELNARAST